MIYPFMGYIFQFKEQPSFDLPPKYYSQLVAIVLQLQPKLFFFWLPLLQPSVIVVMAVILSASHKSHKNKIYFVR